MASQVPKTPTTKRIKDIRNGRALTPSTPSRNNRIHGNGADSSLDAIREANKADIGADVQIVPMNDFCRNYLPPLMTEHRNIDNIVSNLKSAGDLTPEGWKDFSTKPRTVKKVHEDVCYQKLDSVVNSIVAAATLVNGANPSLRIVCNPTQTPTAEGRPCTCRPDCALVLERAGHELRWEDTAITGEHKKDDINVDKANSVC